MFFKLFLLWSFVLLGRPQDLLTFLQPMRPALVLSVMTTGALIFGGHGQRLSAVFSMTETKRYLLFFVIMILGIPFAYHRRVAFQSIFLGYLPNILFFLVLVSEVNSLKRLKSLLFVICLSNLLYSFFGLLYGASFGGRFEIYGGMFDPNDIAYVLISLFPFCIFYLHFNEGFFRRLLAIVTIFSTLAVILLTGSRGGIMGFVVVLAIMLLTKKGGMKMNHKILFIVVLGGVYFVFGEKIDLERYLTLTDIESDYNMTDESGRMQIWKRAIALTLDHPITGVGVACFPMALGYLRESVGLLPKWQEVHNSFLQVAVEVGLVGFVIFARISVKSLLVFLRTSRMEAVSDEAREIRALESLMLLGFAGHLVTAYFVTQGFSIFFTLFFALAAVMGRLQAGLAASEATKESRVRIDKWMTATK